jgi:hypothetical protein
MPQEAIQQLESRQALNLKQTSLTSLFISNIEPFSLSFKTAFRLSSALMLKRMLPDI